MTIHRAGGRRRWWTAKLIAAVAMSAVLVVVTAILTLAVAFAHGWDVTLSVSEYARAGADVGYGRIGDTSPLLGSVIVVALRFAVLSVLALLAVAAAVIIRRPAIAYALPVVALIAYWRLTPNALWALAALALGRLLVSRAEITET